MDKDKTYVVSLEKRILELQIENLDLLQRLSDAEIKLEALARFWGVH